MIDISKHLNLIQNHGYDDWRIGILKCDCGITWKKGEICMFRTYPENTSKCTIEYPHTDEDINKNLSRGRFIKAFKACVAVPVKEIDEIIYRSEKR